MKGAYYNEIEPYCAAWLRNLIAAGHLPAGDVDERSIVEVQLDDVRGYTQAHFFAGLGGWGRALRLAGWPDERPIWTGSCPCQPFSVAGKGRGIEDERHLWPEWFRLVRAARPVVVMGEQVTAAIGKGWLDGVFADLEGEGYACRAVSLPACAVDAPHRRERIWFLADTCSAERWPITEGGGYVDDGPNPGRQEATGGPELGSHVGLWRSPNVREQGGGQLCRPDEGASATVKRASSEPGRSSLSVWPTPHSNASTGAGTQGRKGGLTCRPSLWATPTECGLHNRKGASASSGDGLSTQVKAGGGLLGDTDSARLAQRQGERSNDEP